MGTRINMRTARQHPPVILLVEPKSHGSVEEWLAASRFATTEVGDVFEALERMSDFTLGERTDVVCLHVDSIATQLPLIQTMVATSADEPDVPVIGYTDSVGSNCEKNLQGLESRLGKLIPEHNLTV